MIGSTLVGVSGARLLSRREVQYTTLLIIGLVILFFFFMSCILKGSFVTLLVNGIVGIWLGSSVFRGARNSDTAPKVLVSAPTRETRISSAQSLDKELENLKTRDPHFSKILFLDFVHSLYHKYYTYLGQADFVHLTPYLSKEILEAGRKPQHRNRRTTEIVVGSLEITDGGEYGALDRLFVEIEANYTMTMEGKSKSTRYIVRERWTFNRRKGVLSQEPEKMRNLSCPSCGAPTNFTDSGECAYCSTPINRGEMQWMLEKRTILHSEAFETGDLGTYAQEAGTELPTVKQPGLKDKQAEFQHAHNLPDWNSYWENFQQHIVSPFFLAIYDAWTRQQWHDVRHLVSDRLFESNNFWIEQYKAQGLVNKLEDIQIQKAELAKIERDYFYEAMTVRIFAACRDYVVNESGKVVGGKGNSLRKFTEYWTFMRRTGVEKSEESFDMKSCQSCGAPVDKMGNAGECGYCGSKVSTGDFSWVLFMITQDEVYRG
jgi:predicted lipid-binding transport protein (Tim44 family)